jgi:choline dehydrogenase-like flavoprotein
MSQIIYDAVIVGSGATGGWAARHLTHAGLSVAVIEAGKRVDPQRDYNTLTWPYELERRGFGVQHKREQPIQSECYACNEYSSKWFVNDLQNPYTVAPGKEFVWIRSRQVGGRTLVWARKSYRMSNYEFKAASRDGYGDDWPVSYEDLAPYYDQVERFIGVSGSYEHLAQLPDGVFLPPVPMNCGEVLLKKAVEKNGFHDHRVIPSRVAMLTRPIHEGTLEERNACRWCGHCERGCPTGSYFNSLHSTLPAAERTQRLTLFTDAVASHVSLHPNGEARGIVYIDSDKREEREVRGRVIVLCAGTIESTRILLNSRSPDGAAGLCNSSGTLGCYLFDHVGGGGARGLMPQLDGKRMLPDGRAAGIFIPRFRNLEQRHGEFIRGYGLHGGASQSLWEHAVRVPGWGAQFKRAVRENHPWGIGLTGCGECLPHFENRVTINKDVRDAWGIPVVHIDMSFGDNEDKMVRDMGDAAAEMLEAAGAREIEVMRGPVSTPGAMIHEAGTARMGNDPKTSVLNRFNQAWDVRNLFVTDGACFVSSGYQSPTLTMMAITARACDYLINEMRNGQL